MGTILSCICYLFADNEALELVHLDHLSNINTWLMQTYLNTSKIEIIVVSSCELRS